MVAGEGGRVVGAEVGGGEEEAGVGEGEGSGTGWVGAGVAEFDCYCLGGHFGWVDCVWLGEVGDFRGRCRWMDW